MGGSLTVKDPMGHKTSYSYDGNGNVTSTTDAKEVDVEDLRRTEPCNPETDAANGVTSYTYDLLNNITSITDANSHTTNFTYDDLGRLIKATDPLGKFTTFTYDEAGNVLTRTKRSGAQSVYTYDRMNRVTQAQHTQGSNTITETTAYDAFGNVTSIGNGNITYTYTYDQKNRPLSKTDSRGGTLAYTYDKAGNISTKTGYDGTVTNYQYDSANRLVSEQNQYYLQVDLLLRCSGQALEPHPLERVEDLLSLGQTPTGSRASRP